MLECWFRESLTYRFVFAVIGVLNRSCLAAATEYVGRALVSGKIASCLRYFATRPFYADASLFYRLFEGLNKKSRGLRDRALGVLGESVVFRILSGSRAFPVITYLLIPAVTLYAFIDESGRAVLGDFALFGLWDEAYLLVCALYVFCVWFFKKKDRPLASTPVGAPVVLLIAVSWFLYLTNSTYPQLGFDGFRVVVQYILWFFIMNSYLTDDNKAYLVVRMLVSAGGIMGFHGILQYIMKVPTPKSWTDVAEGTTATRVFSIVESPNILGSIFILIIPLCLALVLQKNRSFNERLIFFVLLGAMGISLILTLSRGAWLGAGVALFLFCLAVNPRWLILLAAGGGAMLLIPSVMNRIQYLLSPQYIISSMAGGRLMRYEKGWNLFLKNEFMGVGLGHFGGAVAMNNKNLVPDTFYMDNYWLKTAVEMGSMGIIAFAIVILALFVWSIRSIKHCGDYDTRLITAGGFAGLCGVLFHNLFENIFEVPYMVVYFWVVASLVLYFGLRREVSGKK